MHIQYNYNFRATINPWFDICNGKNKFNPFAKATKTTGPNNPAEQRTTVPLKKQAPKKKKQTPLKKQRSAGNRRKL
jgi:hypothetical protein